MSWIGKLRARARKSLFIETWHKSLLEFLSFRKNWNLQKPYGRWDSMGIYMHVCGYIQLWCRTKNTQPMPGGIHCRSQKDMHIIGPIPCKMRLSSSRPRSWSSSSAANCLCCWGRRTLDWNTYVLSPVCIHIHLHTMCDKYMYMNVYLYMHMYTYACIYLHTSIYIMYINMNVYIPIYLYIYIHIYIYKYIYIYIYIDIYIYR